MTESPHQEQAPGCVCVAEGQILQTTLYVTSLRPPKSRGGFQRRDTPPSELSYSQDRDTGAEGGAGKANTLKFSEFPNSISVSLKSCVSRCGAYK